MGVVIIAEAAAQTAEVVRFDSSVARNIKFNESFVFVARSLKYFVVGFSDKALSAAFVDAGATDAPQLKEIALLLNFQCQLHSSLPPSNSTA